MNEALDEGAHPGVVDDAQPAALLEGVVRVSEGDLRREGRLLSQRLDPSQVIDQLGEALLLERGHVHLEVDDHLEDLRELDPLANQPVGDLQVREVGSEERALDPRIVLQLEVDVLGRVAAIDDQEPLSELLGALLESREALSRQGLPRDRGLERQEEGVPRLGLGDLVRAPLIGELAQGEGPAPGLFAGADVGPDHGARELEGARPLVDAAVQNVAAHGPLALSVDQAEQVEARLVGVGRGPQALGDRAQEALPNHRRQALVELPPDARVVAGEEPGGSLRALLELDQGQLRLDRQVGVAALLGKGLEGTSGLR